MRKRKTLARKRLFQGYCDLIINKLFSPATPNHYLNISTSYSTKYNDFNRKFIQDKKL